MFPIYYLFIHLFICHSPNNPNIPNNSYNSNYSYNFNNPSKKITNIPNNSNDFSNPNNRNK